MPRYDIDVDTLVAIEAATPEEAIGLIQDAIARLTRVSDHIHSAQVTEILYAAELDADDEPVQIAVPPLGPSA
jgi:hypothetical protein